MNKADTAKMVYEAAFTFERDYGKCSQCTIGGLQEYFPEISDEIFRASDALAGGGAGTTEGTCGALCGGMMVLSSLFGRRKEDFPTEDFRAEDLSMRLYDRFIHEYGSCICKNVQKRIMGRSYNIQDEKEREAFLAAGAHTDKCTDVVGKTASWTAEIILEEKDSDAC